MSESRDHRGDAADEAADAALIDRLYGARGAGEADAEAESKIDDAELAGLASVRALVARVRDEAPVVEPPQALSARLLLAAAEHAPKRASAVRAADGGDSERGLWARMRRWFAPLVAHPGLAAAASLMLVAGVGGALYLRGKATPGEPVRDGREQAQAARGEEAEAPKAEAPPGVVSAPPAPAEGASATSAGAGSAAGATTLDSTLETPSPAVVSEPTVGRADNGFAEGKKPKDVAPTGGSRSGGGDAVGGVPARDRAGAGGGAAKADGASVAGGEVGDVSGEGAEDDWRETSRRDPSDEKVSPDDGRVPVTVVTKEPVQERKAPAKKSKAPAEPAQEPAPAPPPPPEKTDKPEQTDAERARALGSQAISAAKAGRCSEMEKLAAQVRTLDRAYHDATLAKQADVIACRAKK